MTSILAHKSDFLRIVLYGDSLYCTVVGIILFIFALPLTTLVGLPTALILRVLGITLIVWAAAIAYITYCDRLRMIGTIALVANVAWIAFTEVMLMTDLGSMTMAGKSMAMGIAVMVGVFAVAQFLGIRKLGASS